MAKDGVDLAAKALDKPVGPCVTDDVPLVGAEGYKALVNTKEALAARSGLPVERIDHLLGRYGSAIREVLDLVAEHPELGEPLEHAPRYLKVEAYYGASHEGALHLDDLLARRLRVSVDTWDRGVDVAREVADIVAPVLGWDEARIEREVEHYRARVAAERDSQAQLDDRTADSARGPRGPGRSRVSTT
jgi:glycerol-3-phosphate dehydrogenase